MNARFFLSNLVAAAGLVLFSACGGPEKMAYEDAVSVNLEKRADGLSYEMGKTDPFTGSAVSFIKGTRRKSVEEWKEGKPHGKWQRFWPNGRLKQEAQFFAGEQMHEAEWHENGSRKMDCALKNGKPIGRLTLWWPDGRLRRSALFGNDHQPHGHALEYDEMGNVLTDAIFHHGRLISGQLAEEPLATHATAQAH